MTEPSRWPPDRKWPFDDGQGCESCAAHWDNTGYDRPCSGSGIGFWNSECLYYATYPPPNAPQSEITSEDKYYVRVEFDSRDWPKYSDVFLGFAEKIKKNLILIHKYNYHIIPSSIRIYHQDTWKIYFDTIFDGYDLPRQYRESIGGFPVNDMARQYFPQHPNDEGMQVFIGTDYVASVYPDKQAILVPWDLPSAGENIRPICAAIIEVLTELFDTDFDREKYEESVREIKLLAAKEIFIDACVARPENMLRQEMQRMETINKTIKEYNESIILQLREKDELDRVIKGLMKTRPDKNKYLREWDALINNPLVDFIESSPGSIKVHTNTLYTQELPDGTTRELGHYIITFFIEDGSLPKIERKEGIGPEDSFHPHISSNGEPCWGNMALPIATFVSKNEYGIATNLILTFLTEVNHQDVWGRNVFYWPTATVKEGLIPWQAPPCEDCYRSPCDCLRCSYCNLREDECGCSYCSVCGEVYADYNGLIIDNCMCDRCPNCGELTEDCISLGNCLRCENCNKLVDDCSCGHCESCGKVIDEGLSLCDDCETSVIIN